MHFVGKRTGLNLKRISKQKGFLVNTETNIKSSTFRSNFKCKLIICCAKLSKDTAMFYCLHFFICLFCIFFFILFYFHFYLFYFCAREYAMICSARYIRYEICLQSSMANSNHMLSKYNFIDTKRDRKSKPTEKRSIIEVSYEVFV